MNSNELGSDPGLSFLLTEKAESQKLPKRVNIYTVVFRKARMEL